MSPRMDETPTPKEVMEPTHYDARKDAWERRTALCGEDTLATIDGREHILMRLQAFIEGATT